MPCGIRQSARKVPRVELAEIGIDPRRETDGYVFGADGRFAKGTRPGPGRPKGSVDLIRVARRRARETGQNLADIVWEAIQGLRGAACDGDAAAAKILLDRLCGPVEKSGDVTVNVATQVNAGPPPPPTAELGAYLGRLVEVAREQGIELGGGGE